MDQGVRRGRCFPRQRAGGEGVWEGRGGPAAVPSASVAGGRSHSSASEREIRHRQVLNAAATRTNRRHLSPAETPWAAALVPLSRRSLTLPPTTAAISKGGAHPGSNKWCFFCFYIFLYVQDTGEGSDHHLGQKTMPLEMPKTRAKAL